MAVIQTLYCSSVGSYSDTTGGNIRVEFEHNGRVIEDRVGDQQYPTFTAIVDKFLEVTVYLRDMSVAKALALGAAAADLACSLTGGATVSITFKTMTLNRVGGKQPRAEVGELALVFRHQSADGTSVPVN